MQKSNKLRVHIMKIKIKTESLLSTMMETKGRTNRNEKVLQSFTNYIDEQRRVQKNFSDANKSMKTNISEKIEKFLPVFLMLVSIPFWGATYLPTNNENYSIS